jgi:hypothetical protein
MHRAFVTLFMLLIFLINVPKSPGQNDDFYCLEPFDEYRQIKYWARRTISVRDYNFNSGDSNYLGLTYKDKERTNRKNTNKNIVGHFNKEFERILKGKLPFHDTNKGSSVRFEEIYKKYGEQDNFFEVLQAHEEARRKSLYGPNPAAVYCNIGISRRVFPVLYEMKCSVVASKNLMNRGELEEKKLGYSSPELIVGELEHSITQLLEELSKTMKRINNCPK